MELVWAAIFLGLLVAAGNVICTWLTNRNDLAIAARYGPEWQKEEAITTRAPEPVIPLEHSLSNTD